MTEPSSASTAESTCNRRSSAGVAAVAATVFTAEDGVMNVESFADAATREPGFAPAATRAIAPNANAYIGVRPNFDVRMKPPERVLRLEFQRDRLPSRTPPI